MKVRKAVFPVGGRGIRLLPATKAIPKAMFPIIDKPIVQYAVEEAVYSGIEQIIFVTTPSNRAIEDHFSRALDLEQLLEAKKRKDLLQYIRELSAMACFCSTSSTLRSERRGLGLAVLSAKHIVGDEPFAVILPNDLIDAEIPCMKSLLNIFSALEGSVLAVHTVPVEEISTYGNVAFCELDLPSFRKLRKKTYNRERVYKVKKLVQKPNPKKHEHLSNMAIIGRYVLSPDVFRILEKIKPGYEGEIQLTDALEELRKSGQTIYAYEFEGIYHDTRSKVGYVKAFLSYALKQPELAKVLSDGPSLNRLGNQKKT